MKIKEDYNVMFIIAEIMKERIFTKIVWSMSGKHISKHYAKILFTLLYIIHVFFYVRFAQNICASNHAYDIPWYITKALLQFSHQLL